MNKNRIEIGIIIFFLLTVIIAGQFTTRQATQVSKETDVTLTIGYLPITHALPIFELKEMLEKENRGIQVKLQKFSSWTDLMDALHAGEIDGASELIELAMNAEVQGIDLKAVALGHKDGNVIVVANDIKDEKDLKGKVFAIPSKQSSHYILLQEELRKVGIGLDEVTITQLAPAEMPSSLASGAIDGYCVAEPFGAQAVIQGYGKVLARSDELWQDSVCCALVLRDEFIQQNNEAVGQFLAAYEEAGKRLNHDEAVAIAQKYLGQEVQTLETSLEWITYDDLAISKEAYQTLCDKIKENKMMETTPSYETFVYQAE